MARLATKKADGDWSFTGTDWVDRHDKQFDDLLAASRKVDVSKSLVGAVIAFPWADSAAYYRVSKDKPLTLEHIPCSDAWEVPLHQIRGIRKDDVALMIQR